MSLLLSIWICSLLLMVALAAVALYRYEHSGGGSVHAFHVPSGFRGFIAEEAQKLFRKGEQVLQLLKPHATQTSDRFVQIGKRVHDLFIERIFGHIEKERGKAASFFLKHIAEHKEATRQDRDEQGF